jgi:hypothetical protein
MIEVDHTIVGRVDIHDMQHVIVSCPSILSKSCILTEFKNAVPEDFLYNEFILRSSEQIISGM